MSSNNKKIIEVKSPLKLPDTKNYNYLTILRNENTSLSNEIMKGNELIIKLKKKIFNNEQEKKSLLLTNNEKEQEIKEIKIKLEETKDKINKIKEKMKKLEENVITNNNNNNNSKQNELNNNIQNTIVRLQNKITELELQLKNKGINNNKKKIFISLTKNRNISMLYKNTINSNNNNNAIKKIDNNNYNKDDLFLTGRHEAMEYQEKNIWLECQLNKLKINLNNIEIEKNNLIKLLEQYSLEKKKILSLLNEKNEKINEKLNEGNKLNNNIMQQLIENKKYNDLLFQTTLKKQNLEKDIYELENIIFKQKNKINDLSNSVEKIIKIIKNKNEEINTNKNCITHLENNIREINKKFLYMNHNKYIDNNIKNEELPKLLEQIEQLKKEYINLIEKNKINHKLADSIKINYNIINNNGNNIVKDLNKNSNFIKKKYKNISIIPNERYENKNIKINGNFQSRNYFRDINNMSIQKSASSNRNRRNKSNMSTDILLNKKLLNDYNYKNCNNMYNSNKRIKFFNKKYNNYINNNSMRNINNKINRNNVNSRRLLKKIVLDKNQKRVHSSINIINNKYTNIMERKNIKSFSGINNDNYTLEDKKINEFKDLLDKLINDL